MKRFDKFQNMWNYGKDGRLEEFQVTEKLDGANFRFKFNSQGNLYFGSRNVEGIGRDAKGGENFNSTFGRYMDFVRKQVLANTSEDERKGMTHLTFFGEAMIPHKIKYDVPDDKLVVGFAVYDEEKEIYLREWQEFFQLFGLPTVRVIEQDSTDPHKWEKLAEGNFEVDKTFRGLDIPTREIDGSLYYVSDLDEYSVPEGVMLMDFDHQTAYKAKTKEFIETERSSSIKTSDAARMVQKYITPYRIDKALKKMEVEGAYNPKNPFVTLQGMLFKDIFEEASDNDLKELLKGILLSPIADAIREDKGALGTIAELARRKKK